MATTSAEMGSFASSAAPSKRESIGARVRDPRLDFFRGLRCSSF